MTQSASSEICIKRGSQTNLKRRDRTIMAIPTATQVNNKIALPLLDNKITGRDSQLNNNRPKVRGNLNKILTVKTQAARSNRDTRVTGAVNVIAKSRSKWMARSKHTSSPIMRKNLRNCKFPITTQLTKSVWNDGIRRTCRQPRIIIISIHQEGRAVTPGFNYAQGTR